MLPFAPARLVVSWVLGGPNVPAMLKPAMQPRNRTASLRVVDGIRTRALLLGKQVRYQPRSYYMSVDFLDHLPGMVST